MAAGPCVVVLVVVVVFVLVLVLVLVSVLVLVLVFGRRRSRAAHALSRVAARRPRIPTLALACLHAGVVCRGTVGFHNFNFNLRVSNPNKLIVDVFVTRCRISMCQGLGPKKYDEISEIDRTYGHARLLPLVVRQSRYRLMTCR